jgi:hypothetical protein
MGLALIPGANASLISQLISADSNTLGLCNRTLQDALVSAARSQGCRATTAWLSSHIISLQVQYYDARIAYFNLALDRLQVLRLPFPDIIFPLVNVTDTKGLPPTMVAVAFR